MTSFDYLTHSKEELLKQIRSIKNNIATLEKYGMDVSIPLRKIDTAINNIISDEISVVLVGAFSDGKTSVAAGWINEKLDDMKISSDESSDEILCYIPDSLPAGCKIVDTPGLFGNKIGSDESGSEILLSDKTKKYISEASLILYVVAAKNPIKDSHKPCIKWILKDLNKLNSTIFVINRMDDVADLTDEDDFEYARKTKTDDLKSKLLDCGLTSEEAERVHVVCISAAPNGKSIEAWSNYHDEYVKRSHLHSLESITNEILVKSKKELIVKTGCDVLNAELVNTLKQIEIQECIIRDETLPELKETLRRNKNDLATLRKRIVRSKKEVRERLKDLERDIILKIRAATPETIKNTLEDEIGLIPGKEGHRLDEAINEIFSDYANQYSRWTVDLSEHIQGEYNRTNAVLDTVLNKGAHAAANGLKGAAHLGIEPLKAGIFAARDLLGKVGIVIKFKPWQVVHLAQFAQQAIPAIGTCLEVGLRVASIINGNQKSIEFEKSKDEIKNAISDTFYELRMSLQSDEDYIDAYAPDYRILEEQISQDEKDIKEQEELIKNFVNWKKNIVEADYQIIY